MALQLTFLRPQKGKVPGFDTTVKALHDVPTILYRALEFGTSQNRAFFETLSQNERPRPHLREMIVRDQAKQFLVRNHFRVEDEAVDVGNEPLAALMIRCGPVQARVLKGHDGTIPGCGTSERRRAFYNQASIPYQNSAGLVSPSRLNLVFIWDFDRLFNLANIWLACPMRAGKNSSDVLLHWQELLPHPALTVEASRFDVAQDAADQELEKLLREDQPEIDEETRQA